MQTEFFDIKTENNTVEFGINGDWIISNAEAITRALEKVEISNDVKSVRFHCNGLGNIDTSGAWVLYKKYAQIRDSGIEADFDGFKEKHFRIVKTILDNPKEHLPPQIEVVRWQEPFIILGKSIFKGLTHLGEAFSFLGQLFMAFCKTLGEPRRLRFTSVIRHIQETGFNAIPIVSMIAFLFSIVLAYQGAEQLKQFGATVFMVNLTSVSILREIGVLMTAIIVAGRTGSAFAAEIGVMKLREEVDALHTMGTNIYEVLVIPRVLALFIALPLLTVIANLIGLAGGGLMAWLIVDMPPHLYLERVLVAVTLNSFLVGMIKAPFFAIIIATVGTFRGLQVSGAADSIGKQTTLAVVQSIALIIVADAVFTIIFTYLGM